jgi:putative hemolysin
VEEKKKKMPKAFNNCVKQGGRVRTKELGGGKYIHICFKGGKSYKGEKKKKKEGQKKS